MGSKTETTTDGSKPTIAELKQMGLVVSGHYPDVSEVKRYDPGTDAWTTIPVNARTIGASITVFEPVTEGPAATAR